MGQTASGGGRTRNVLIVDDDQGVRDVIAETLVEEGYVVATAGSAREALASLAGGRPDVILLDTNLPDLSREEFAHRYRAAPGPHAALVVVSGLGDVEALAARIGAAAVLPKPFELDDLFAVLAAQMRCIPA